jgi:hypothetical protein
VLCSMGKGMVTGVHGAEGLRVVRLAVCGAREDGMERVLCA